MSKLKIAIVISTTRAARFGHKPAQWIRDIAAERDDMEIEIVDLRDFPLPFFDAVVVFGGDENVAVKPGNLLLPPLRNRILRRCPGIRGHFKKAAGFVGYGSVGGARAIEQLRLVAAELQLATIRTGVYIQGAEFMAVWKDGKELKDVAYLQAGAKDMLDQLAWWTKALKVARDRERLATAA